jgi:hypothetical protein
VRLQRPEVRPRKLSVERRSGLDAIVLMRRRRRLPVGSVGVLLIGLVMADDASSDGANFAVPRQMARDAANDGAFDAVQMMSGFIGVLQRKESLR